MKDEADAKRSTASSVLDLPQLGSVLAFDFGEKRLGVAVGDLKLKIAHPLTTITSEVNDKRFAAITELISEYRPVLLVVGLPTNADGTEHEIGRLARKFAQRLTGRFGIRTVLVDEHLSSAAAAAALTEAGVRGARQKLWLDRVAAQQILQQFFDDPRIVS
jgi:putative Holliday junction resolvase